MNTFGGKVGSPWWPLWAALGFPALWVALHATPLGWNLGFFVFGFIPLALIWIGLGVCAAMMTARRLWRRAWRRAIISGVLLAAVLSSRYLVYPCYYLGRTIRFAVNFREYSGALRKIPSRQTPRLLVIDEGGATWSSVGYVYDPSGALLLPAGERSAVWSAAADKTELACGYSAKAIPAIPYIPQHWYVVTFDC